MPVSDAQLALLRAMGGAQQMQPEPQEEDRSWFWKAMDYIDRPYSTVMGGVTGLATGEDFLTRMERGITGKQHYGFYDLATAAGADPQSALTRYGSIALDIFPGMFLDPLTLVTGGFSKAGKAAKVAGLTDDAAKMAKGASVVRDAMMPARTVRRLGTEAIEAAVDLPEAARRGLWSPLNVAGTPIVPKAVAAPWAKGVQTIGDLVKGRVDPMGVGRVAGMAETTSKPYQALSKMFGGRNAGYAGFVTTLRKMGISADEREVLWANHLNEALEKGLFTEEQRVWATHLIENPKLIEDFAQGKKVAWLNVPRTPTKADSEAFWRSLKPLMDAKSDAGEAARVGMLHGLSEMRKAVMQRPGPRTYETATLSELVGLPGFAGDGLDLTPEQLLEGLWKQPDSRAAFDARLKGALGPDAHFAGVVAKSADPADKLISRYYRRFNTRSGQIAKDSFGWDDWRSMTKGDPDATIIIGREAPGALTDQVAKAGGSRSLHEKARTTLRVLDKLEQALKTPGRKVWDFKELRKVDPATGTVDAILDTLKLHVFQAQVPNNADYTRAFDRMREWALIKVFDDPAERWRFAQQELTEQIGVKAKQIDELVQRKSRVTGVIGDAEVPYSKADEERLIQLVQERDELAKALENLDPIGASAARFEEILGDVGWPRWKQPMDNVPIDLSGVTPEIMEGASRAVEYVDGMRREMTDGFVARGADRIPGGQERYLTHFFSGKQKMRKGRVVSPGAERLAPPANADEMRKLFLQEIQTQHPFLSTEDALKLVESRMTEFRDFFRMRRTNGGNIDEFLKRKYPFSVLQMNYSDIPVEFEDDLWLILNKQHRDVNNYFYGFDAYQEAAARYGKNIGEGDVVPKGFVRVQYATPFHSTSPFANVVIPKEVDDIVRGVVGAANTFTTDAGTKTLLDMMHGIRRWWSAWTLGPFPAYHARNFVSNMMLNHIGGLSPVGKFGLNLDGIESYRAGARMVFKSKKDTGALKAVVEKLRAAFPNADITEAGLERIMKGEGVIGVGMRDLDWEEYGRQLVQQMDKATKGQKIRAALSINPRKNFFVSKGFALGRKNEDMARASLFLDRLKKNALATSDWDTAVADATKWVNKHLYDYTDLSPFERNVAKAFVPFYCVPESHEILTRNGWKHHWDLEKGEDVLAYDHKTGELRWEPLLDVATFRYDGELLALRRRGMEFLFTEDHRWPVVTSESFVKGKWYGNDRKIVRSYNLNSSHRIPLTGYYVETESILSERHAAILGWVVTDGYFRWRGNHCEMLIYQSPEKHLDAITALTGSKPRKPHPETGVCAVPVKNEDVKIITEHFRSKKDLESIVGRLSALAANAMYNAMFMAEGCTARRCEQSFAQDPKLNGPVVSAFQMLALMTGRTANAGSRGCYVRSSRYVRPGAYKDLPRQTYSGTIWCPKTPSGTWVMRNSGAVIITGNTWMRKNTPHMLDTLVHEPGKMGYIYRAYFGAWNAYDEEIEPGDMAKWIQDGLGVPVRYRDAGDGQLTYSVWMPFQGWVPWGDVNELAESFRSRDGFAQFWISKLNPALKEPLEQALNRDTFRGEQISKGEVRDILGFAAPDWAEHVMQNFRLYAEISRLNPGGVFTKMMKWQGYDTRPHRADVAPREKYLRAVTGLAGYDQRPVQNLQREIKALENDASQDRWKARLAAQRGYWPEQQKYLDEAVEKKQKAQKLRQRVGHLLQVQATYTTRKPGA